MVSSSPLFAGCSPLFAGSPMFAGCSPMFADCSPIFADCSPMFDCLPDVRRCLIVRRCLKMFVGANGDPMPSNLKKIQRNLWMCAQKFSLLTRQCMIGSPEKSKAKTEKVNIGNKKTQKRTQSKIRGQNVTFFNFNSKGTWRKI